GSGGGVGCVVVVPVVERQRSGVGGGVVLAAWVVVLAMVRRTLPEKWRRQGSGVTRWWWRVKESGVEDRGCLFGAAETAAVKRVFVCCGSAAETKGVFVWGGGSSNKGPFGFVLLPYGRGGDVRLGQPKHQGCLFLGLTTLRGVFVRDGSSKREGGCGCRTAAIKARLLLAY
nr:hypothetical protein [Tanacetum cinerariifolium]